MAHRNDDTYIDDKSSNVPESRGRGHPRLRGHHHSTRAATIKAFSHGSGKRLFESPAQDPSNSAPSTIFEQPRQGSRVRSRTSSPAKSSSKGRGKTFTDAKADSSIDIGYLRSCNPRVSLMRLEHARKSGPIPQAVIDLNSSLSRHEVDSFPPLSRSLIGVCLSITHSNNTVV